MLAHRPGARWWVVLGVRVRNARCLEVINEDSSTNSFNEAIPQKLVSTFRIFRFFWLIHFGLNFDTFCAVGIRMRRAVEAAIIDTRDVI